MEEQMMEKPPDEEPPESLWDRIEKMVAEEDAKAHEIMRKIIEMGLE